MDATQIHRRAIQFQHHEITARHRIADDEAWLVDDALPAHRRGQQGVTIVGDQIAADRDLVFAVDPERPVFALHRTEGVAKLSAANIAAAVDDSLTRLKTDHIDVYFAHLDDAETPLEETLEAFGKLVQAGKVRALGASNYSVDRLRQALAVSSEHKLPRYEVVQPPYNLYDRSFEDGLAAVVKEQELGAVSYFSLASGFLTGKYRSVDDLKGAAREAFLKDYFDARGLKLLEALRNVAAELGATPAQVSLAWLMARPGLTAPIASATRPEQLDDILGAAQLTLPDSAIATLDAASA